MNALEVKSLTKWYGSAKGVEDVSFAVAPGEIFGCLGPNGSGKTTTIRCIMGLIKPTAGEAFILGDRIRPGRATRHDDIGYLPGEFHIWPEFNAERTLAILAAIGRTSDTKQHRRRIANRLGLDLNRRVEDLSKGNRQKVGIVYAFQHRPRLLILDEPTIGLDPLVSQTVLQLIREAADAGAAVILSSHDLTEVAAVCGRAAILRKGRLVELAPISDIVHQGVRRLKVWFVEGANVPTLDPDRIPGASIVAQEPGLLHIAYHGPADNLIKWLARFPVDRIAATETSLEEAFMQYYSQDAAGKPDKP